MRTTFDLPYQRVLPFAEEEITSRIDTILADLPNRTVVVVGLGESGFDSALFLLSKGAKVRCTDSAATDALGEKKRQLEKLGAEVELGDHTGRFYAGCELVVVSPGVHPSSLPLVLADSEGVPIISEMELGFRFCNSCVIAVTGTNGKTTTCELINHILQVGGLSCATAGNIGLPLVRKAAEPHPPDYLVVEVSSFQLERIHRFRPFISAILNITADHLDRYDSFEDYAKAKRRIAENQRRGDFLILNENLKHLFPVPPARVRAEAPEPAQRSVRALGRHPFERPGMDGDYPTVLTFGQTPSAHLSVSNGTIISRVSGQEKRYEAHCHPGRRGALGGVGGPGRGGGPVVPRRQRAGWRLRGQHNLENAAVAIAVAEILGIPEESIYSALSSFAAPQHRIEFVDRVLGVDFVDDSKATNVDAVVRALESFSQPVILIAGGRDKGGAYDPVTEAAREKVKLAVLIGEAKEKMYSSLHKVLPSVFAVDLEGAVELALQNAARGDVVLLSPACSSFDMFKDYKHRGQVFQAKVKQLRRASQERRRNHEAA
jgi:UDP-N-acetylmuramoylalanine--D-glutamate ligase